MTCLTLPTVTNILDELEKRTSYAGVSKAAVWRASGLSATLEYNWRYELSSPTFRSITSLAVALDQVCGPG